MKLLAICAVEAEAEACRSCDLLHVAVSGVGRTNAAIETTRSVLENGPFSGVLSLGVAGALPQVDPLLEIGDVVVATESVYHEEGIATPSGFQDMTALGFPLGDFQGNRIPATEALLARFGALGRNAPVATVATCSGSDDAAIQVRSRTGAVAEAMEGAAVLHVARTFGLPALEMRVISNTTGSRDRQVWDLTLALARLGDLVDRFRS
ncbi:MAG: futalosine hydrolase [Planctomycetota bacterium]|nr:futalosine hydrolase [Planctomycetota bacterium]